MADYHESSDGYGYGGGYGDGSDYSCHGYGSGHGSGYGDGFYSGYGHGSGYGCGYGGGSIDGAGYGYGDGDGSGAGAGYGYSNSHSCGYGCGFGDGYGDSYGYGEAGDGHGDGVLVATIGEYEVRAAITPWGRTVRVGCQVHGLDVWRERWWVIAREHDVEVSAEEVARLIALIEAAPMGPEWLESKEDTAARSHTSTM